MKRPELATLRARAEGSMISGLLAKLEAADNMVDFKKYSWLLERRFPDRFGRKRSSIVNNVVSQAFAATYSQASSDRW